MFENLIDKLLKSQYFFDNFILFSKSIILKKPVAALHTQQKSANTTVPIHKLILFHAFPIFPISYLLECHPPAAGQISTLQPAFLISVISPCLSFYNFPPSHMPAALKISILFGPIYSPFLC